MRMLFVPNPHVRQGRDWAASYVPLELLSAMATARAAGVEPALFDVNRLVEHGRLDVEAGIWSRAAALLAEAEPDLVFFETWSGTLHNTLQLLSAARQRLPRTPLLLVGAGTSALAGQVLAAFADVDGVLRGEPEPAVRALAEASGGRQLPSAPGLARRRGALELPPLAAVDDLDALPRPAFDLALLHPGDTLPVEAGRGCGQGCSFCALAGHWSPRYRPRSAASLAAEMIELAGRYPGSSLDLTPDPVFFNDPRRLVDLCRLLEGRGPRWSCHARVDRLSSEGLARLAGAGCCGLLFGIESGCPQMQRRIGKELCLSRLEPTLAAAERLKLETRTSFIIGFPEEDDAALARTARLLLRARAAGAAATPVQLLRAYPGSAVHRRHAAELLPEPLLATASAEDAASQALIAAHPAIFPTAFRVPGRLPRERSLAAWVVLSMLPEVLQALERHGVEPGALLPRLALPDPAITVEQALSGLCAQLLELSPELGVDTTALEDLLGYHQAVFLVGREPTSEVGFDLGGADQLRLEQYPEEVCPVTCVPWRLLWLSTDLEQLLDGDLRPPGRADRSPVLIAKVPAAEASYYTRRAFAVEAFSLDALGAALLPLCDGAHDLLRIAQTLAVQRGEGPRQTLRACREIVVELCDGGVLALERPPAWMSAV